LRNQQAKYFFNRYITLKDSESVTVVKIFFSILPDFVASPLAFNKRSPSQVVQKPAFWGRPILKLNPERAVEIPE
jgi:hypothetical protein